jgi:DNA-binding transcriptional LysR family regulator
MNTPNLDMDALRTLATGLELGSFAKAADRLCRSPSAISAQLRKLEDQLGVPLVKKSGRVLVPTEAGESLLGYARRILELNDEAVGAVRGAEMEGWVRVGLPQDFADAWLTQMLGRFARAHPRIRVEACAERNAVLRERLAAGTLDFALVWGEPADLPHSTPLIRLPIAWIGPAHVAAPRRDADDALPLVLFESPCLFRNIGVAALDAAGISWRIAFTSSSLSGLWAATAAGLGLTVRTAASLPTSLRDYSDDLPALPEIALTLATAEANLSPAAARLADILKETLMDATRGLVRPAPAALHGANV